jgi:hypothetical protein
VEILLMYTRIGARLAETSRRTTSERFVRAVWSPDAIIERDRRDFAESLKAQAQRLNRKEVRRD